MELINDMELIDYVENHVLCTYKGITILVLKLNKRKIKCTSSKDGKMFGNEKEYTTRFKDKALSKYIDYLDSI